MSDLARRQLGANGPTVSVLGFGAMELRGTVHRNPRPLADSVVDQLLNTVLDEGITFIDTSIDYGASEESIGRYLGSRRDEFVLASKAGCPLDHQTNAPYPGGLPHDYSRGHVRAGVEQSLRRLRTDHLDLLQLHISPALELLRREGTIEELVALRDEGKIAAFGVSSTLPNIDDHLGVEEFSAFQVPYSALERQIETRIQTAAQRGYGIVVRGGVAQAGKRPKTTSDGRPVTWADTNLDELRDGESVQGFLLRFALSTPGTTTVIVGTADPEHLRDNVRAARRGPLPDDVYAEALRRLDAVGITPAASAD